MCETILKVAIAYRLPRDAQEAADSKAVQTKEVFKTIQGLLHTKIENTPEEKSKRFVRQTVLAFSWLFQIF